MDDARAKPCGCKPPECARLRFVGMENVWSESPQQASKLMHRESISCGIDAPSEPPCPVGSNLFTAWQFTFLADDDVRLVPSRALPPCVVPKVALSAPSD